MPRIIKAPKFKTEAWEINVICSRCEGEILFFEDDLKRRSVTESDYRGDKSNVTKYYFECPCCNVNIPVERTKIPKYVHVKKNWV